MGRTTAILAILGCVWAFSGIAGWILTISSLWHLETHQDIIHAAVTFCLLISGYWVWFGWVRYSFTRRFPKVSVRTFWLISLVHHSLCVLYLLSADVWGGGDDPWWIPVWIIANIFIAIYFIVRSSQMQPIK